MKITQPKIEPLKSLGDQIAQVGARNATQREKGYYVMDRFSHTYLRGPFESAQAAGAVRSEMENHADDEQNEKWNLWIVDEKYDTA